MLRSTSCQEFADESARIERLETRLCMAATGVAQSVVAADFNQDGFTDIVETRVGGRGGLSLLVANGNGTFQPAVAIGGTGFARGASVASADFNKDGAPDLVVYGGKGLGQLTKNNNGGTKPVSGGLFVLLNNGDGTFQRAISLKNGTINAGGNANGRITAGDLTGDGNADILVTSNKFGTSANTSIVQPTPTSLGTGATTIPGMAGGMITGGMNGVLGTTTTDVFGNTGTTVLGTTGTVGATTPTATGGTGTTSGGVGVTGAVNGADVGFLITGNGNGTFNAAKRISLA